MSSHRIVSDPSLTLSSETYEMELALDINSEIFSVDYGQKFSLALARSINLDGTLDEGGTFPHSSRLLITQNIPFVHFLSLVFDQTDRKTLLDDYQYVMYGKVFRYSQEKAPSVKVYALISTRFVARLLILAPQRRLRVLRWTSHDAQR